VSAPRIAVVDYGMGNRRSVEKALLKVGARASITRDHGEIEAADGVVVPGVGAFPRAMDNLRELGLDELLARRLDDGAPVLGICLGMQLGFERSVEKGGSEGLGLVRGEVVGLAAPGLKVPHIGWNEVTFSRPSPLTEGLGERAAFYHVHSYVAVPELEEDVVGRGDYGGAFVSVVEREPFFGVQFHPEKSSADGLRLLGNFSAICARIAA
jgi:glutamine amidotransferase